MEKEVLQAPVLPPLKTEPKGGTLREIRWQIAGGWAVGDCYKYTFYIGRYVIDRKGRHGVLQDRKRNPITLEWLFDSLTDFLSFDRSIQCEKDEIDEVRDFLDPQDAYFWKLNGMSVILALEAEYNEGVRRRAEERKQGRIDDLMDTVPVLPDGLMEWMLREVWPTDFLFPSDAEYDTEDRHGTLFYCTSCGNLHRWYRDVPKLGEAKICPNTGRMAVRRRKGTRIEDRERVMVLQRVNHSVSVARHLTVRRSMGEDMREYDVLEEARIVLHRRNIFGKSQKDKVYYGQYQEADEFYQSFSDHNPWQKHLLKCRCYPEGIRDALEGTMYERTPVEKMAARRWKLDYNQVMLSAMNPDIPPILEYMTGMNLKRMTAETVEALNFGHLYSTAINTEGKTAREVLGIDAQRIGRLRGLDGGRIMLAWLQEEQRTGRRIKDNVLIWMQRVRLRPEDLRFILPKMSPEQAMNYLIRESGGKPVYYTLGIWEDYLSMAGRLGLDVNDEIVYRTKNLFARHDEAVEEFARRKDEIEAAEFERKYGGITKACARIREKFDYTGEKFCIITPRGAQDIIEDSRQLHHCAGASERYYDRIEQDETYILFLRRTEEPEKAYYTLEVEPDGTARQKRSAYNRQPDLQEINAFLREWQAVVSKRLGKADKEAARISAAKRAEEMEALASSDRQRDIDLFRALEADLLAAAT